MDGSDRWLPSLVVTCMLIIVATLLYFVLTGSVHELQYEIGDLRRDVGAVQRQIEFRGEYEDRDVERILYELRRSR